MIANNELLASPQIESRGLFPQNLLLVLELVDQRCPINHKTTNRETQKNLNIF